MNTNDIVLKIDAEIARLQEAKTLLTGTSSVTRTTRKRRHAATSGSGQANSFNSAQFAAKPRKRRALSAEARARIAAAQKARWAKFRKAAQ
jgi:hypothetical protein